MAQMRDRCVSGSPVSAAQALNWSWTWRKSFLELRIVRNIEAGVAQAGDDVGGEHEGVLAEKAQEELPGLAAEPRALLGQEIHEADLIGWRPVGQEFGETAVPRLKPPR